MKVRQSDRVRGIVRERYVQPAIAAGNTRFSIRVRDVLKDAEATADFPRGRTPMVCSVLQSHKLLNETGLEIESIDGPPSRQSRTVVVHYRVAKHMVATDRSAKLSADKPGPAVERAVEAPAARAKRLSEKLRGLLKAELAEYGGAEGFVQWVRSDDEQGAA